MIVAGRLDEAEQSLRAAEKALEALLEGLGDPEELAEYRALAGIAACAATLLAAQRGDVHEAALMSQRALALLPEDEVGWRLGTLTYLAEAYQAAGDTAAAYDTLVEADRLSSAHGNDLNTMMVLFHLGSLYVTRGSLTMAATTYRRLMQLPVLQKLPLLGTAHVGLGRVLVEQNDLALALEHLIRGIGLLTPISGLNTNIILGYVELARLHRAEGDVEAAGAALRQAEAIAAVSLRPAMSLPAEWARLRHLLAVGDVEATRLLADQAYANLEELPPHRREPGLLAVVRARLAQGCTDDALNMLGSLRSRAEQAGRTGTLIEVLILQALAFQQKGDGTRAVQALLAALVPAEPEGYARLFLDEGEALRPLLAEAQQQGAAGRYARTLLAQFPPEKASPEAAPAPRPGTAHPLVEPLTGRERDVLRLLAAGLSGPEIASALVMTQNTVKTHLKNLYSKLDAHGRDEALRRARELDLL